MGMTLVTPATATPVAVHEIAGEIPDFNQANNAWLESLITGATDLFQELTCQQFMQATFKQTLDNWPWSGGEEEGVSEIYIDKRPVLSVTHIKYYDEAGDLQTLDSDEYWVDPANRPPRIRFKPTAFSWPVVEFDRPGAIEVTVLLGYSTIDLVPALAKQAIKLQARYWYDNREAEPVDDSAEAGAAQTKPGAILPAFRAMAHLLSESGYT